MRVVPLENEAINECWISDRDRFSYEGLNSAERLTAPMLKQDGSWREVDWQAALEYARHALIARPRREGRRRDRRARFAADARSRSFICWAG